MVIAIHFPVPYFALTFIVRYTTYSVLYTRSYGTWILFYLLRNLSLLQKSLLTNAARLNINDRAKQDIIDAYNDFSSNLKNTDNFNQIPEIKDWFDKVLEHNTTCGKLKRIVSVVHSYKVFAQLTPLGETQEDLKLANLLGWCNELLNSYLLMLDDIMDCSEIRRGNICWYKLEDVGLGGINDCNLVEASIYEILRIYFKEKPYYMKLVELFNDVVLKCILGQHLDLRIIKNGRPQYHLFTFEHYERIMLFKSGFYSFYLPINLAMTMNYYNEDGIQEKIKKFMLEMGKLLQYSNDFTDCYGNLKQTGKDPKSDISEGKCTWLSIVALQLLPPKKRKVFEENYGKKDDASIQVVEQLFNELEMPKLFDEYNLNLYKSTCEFVEQLPEKHLREIFQYILDDYNNLYTK